MRKLWLDTAASIFKIIWPPALHAMVLVKPATVVQWNRKGFRLYWRWRSSGSAQDEHSTEIRDLIRQMSMANRLWGAPRIQGELLKLVLQSTAKFKTAARGA